jgi:methylthioribulose-1-phosphate dehydratase
VKERVIPQFLLVRAMSKPIDPFICPSALDDLRLREMCQLARRSYDRGWNAGTGGNFSVRSTRDGLMWMSPSGVCKGELDPKGFIAINLSNASAHGYALVKPSDETALHAGILRANPKAVCVAHAHTPALVRRSLLDSSMKFSGQEMQKAFGSKTHDGSINLPMIENTQDMTSLGANVSNLINPQIPLIVLRGHGAYVWADDVQKALNILEAVEFLAGC